jgi:hypothetical protein
VLSSSLSLVDTSNNTGTIFDGLLSVESSVFTSHALNEDLGVLVNEDMWHGLLGVDASVKSWYDTSHFGGWSCD